MKPLEDQNVTEVPAVRKFVCELSKPNVEVQWLRNNEPIKPSSKYNVESKAETHTLTISDIGLDDDADYQIRVKKTNLSSTAALFIKSKRNSFRSLDSTT